LTTPENPLTRDETTILATYNSERVRGLVHTDVWHERMTVLQRRFDRAQRDRRIADGYEEVAPNMWVHAERADEVRDALRHRGMPVTEAFKMRDLPLTGGEV